MIACIVVPLNGAASGEAAIPVAAELARANAARLHLVFVDGAPRADPMSDEFFRVDADVYASSEMVALAATLRRDFGVAVTTAVLNGPVVRTIASYAASADADMIVMATQGRTGWSRAWIGSVADELLHAIQLPILLVRSEPGAPVAPSTLARIFVALDGSPAAECALESARTLAQASRSTLILGRVVAPIPTEVNMAITAGVMLADGEATQAQVDTAQEYLERVAESVRDHDALPVETAVELSSFGPVSSIGTTVADMALRDHADVVALTTHGRGASRLLVGSVADKVLRETHCAVLICHATATAAGRTTQLHLPACPATVI